MKIDIGRLVVTVTGPSGSVYFRGNNRDIMAALSRAEGKPLTRAHLVECLYETPGDEPEWSDALIGVCISRIRKRLESIGISRNVIASANGRASCGYTLHA